MNKQEVIEKLQSKAVNHYSETSGWTKKIKLDIAIDIINQLDEPEKPVVPQFVADWYEEHKINFEFNLYRFCVDFHESELPENLHVWFISKNNRPIQTLVNMHQFGYEVEKEKLYTARLILLNNDYNFLNRNREDDRILFSDGEEGHCYTTYFTQTELEELNVWENPAFEVEEVEE